MRRLLTRLAAGACLAVAAGTGAQAATWENVPLPTPPGGQFSVPAGFVSDLSFWAPNRGLMAVAGNNSVPGGLYSFDGESWHQLSTVCGAGPNTRIAWAGPREFWTITAASAGSPVSGQGLCHYQDGAVVGSYSFYNLPEFESTVDAAACRAANDCWFGGTGTASADGSRVGAFHLHWDGATMQAVYDGQGRGVSDLVAHRGAVLESTFVGPSVGAQGSRPFLRQAEAVPALLHRIDGLSFANDPFTVAPATDVPDDGTDLRSLDTDGTTAWAVGGGANSGPATANGFVARQPVAIRKDGDGPWQQLTLSDDLPTTAWFGSVAAVPGTRAAWATLTDTEVGGATTSGETGLPRVASIAADGTTEVETLDARTGAAARGAATAIACPTADDCWVATARGYLYRRTSGGTYARDTDPAFQGTITIRPNEAAAQAIPDAPPEDDSRLLAPPVELPAAIAESELDCPAPPALVTRVKASVGKLSKRRARQANPVVRMTVRFRLARTARVGMVARRGTKVVARAKSRTLKAGTRRLTVAVRRKAFPKAIRFQLQELTKPQCDAGSSDAVSTGGTR